jgi:hypothetical protein
LLPPKTMQKVLQSCTVQYYENVANESEIRMNCVETATILLFLLTMCRRVLVGLLLFTVRLCYCCRCHSLILMTWDAIGGMSESEYKGRGYT